MGNVLIFGDLSERPNGPAQHRPGRKPRELRIQQNHEVMKDRYNCGTRESPPWLCICVSPSDLILHFYIGSRPSRAGLCCVGPLGLSPVTLWGELLNSSIRRFRISSSWIIRLLASAVTLVTVYAYKPTRWITG